MGHYLIKSFTLSLTIILTAFHSILNAQIPNVPCICETSSLELKPMIKSPRIILVNDPENQKTSWLYETIDTFAEAKPKNTELIIPEKVIETSKATASRTAISRKRKSKGKIRLRKRNYKKYKGQCPSFN